MGAHSHAAHSVPHLQLSDHLDVAPRTKRVGPTHRYRIPCSDDRVGVIVKVICVRMMLCGKKKGSSCLAHIT
jgi:hypothetical protein